MRYKHFKNADADISALTVGIVKKCILQQSLVLTSVITQENL